MTHPHKKARHPEGQRVWSTRYVRATSLKRRIAGADPATQPSKLPGGALSMTACDCSAAFPSGSPTIAVGGSAPLELPGTFI